MAAVIAEAPDQGLPKQCGKWADLKGAYRLLSHPSVDPHAIQQPHRRLTLESCAASGHDVALLVQDTTTLDFSNRTKVKGLGRTGDGGGRGFLQHTTLALNPDGELLGVAHQSWHNRIEAPPGETRTQRRQRWSEPQVWADHVRAIGSSPAGCRFIHVGDRHSDVFGFFTACRDQGVGFVTRAMHDRYVDQDADQLWSRLEAQPATDSYEVKVPARRDRGNRITRPARQAVVSIRYAKVRLQPPRGDARYKTPLKVWAALVREDDPPADADPVQWMLLTSEPVVDVQDARRIVRWYEHRWRIEEWHRVQKEGCRLEASQLDQAADLHRLASITAVVSVRMLQLRDLADAANPDASDASEPDSTDARSRTIAEARRRAADDPAALRACADWSWIVVCAHLSRRDPHTLTPRQFWRAIALRGGWIGRKSDGRPGWKTLWRGWSDIRLLAQGAQWARPIPPDETYG